MQYAHDSRARPCVAITDKPEAPGRQGRRTMVLVRQERHGLVRRLAGRADERHQRADRDPGSGCSRTTAWQRPMRIWSDLWDEYDAYETGRITIVVVGGGAAGMMAAGMAAAGLGAHVTLLEQNGRLGKKLLHHRQGPVQRHERLRVARTFCRTCRRTRAFCTAPSRAFPRRTRWRFSSSTAAQLKTERGNRVFPDIRPGRAVRHWTRCARFSA